MAKKRKKRSVGLYGNVGLERGYCWHCNTTCIILDNEYQCCGRKARSVEISELPVDRMSEPVQRRKRLRKFEQNKILQDQDFCCIYCGKYFGSCYTRKGENKIRKTRVHFDHFIPFVFSSNNKEVNIVAACNICNLIKSDKIFNNIEEATLYVTEKAKEKEITYI